VSTGEEYCLIAERESPQPANAIGQLLAQHLTLHRADAIARVRYGGGLIAESVTREQAERLASELGAIGVATRRIEADRWLAVPRGYEAYGLEFLDDTLLANLANGGSIIVARDDILGVHLHALRPEGDERAEADAASVAATARLQAAALEPAARLTELSARARTLLENLRQAKASGAELHVTFYCAGHIGPVRLRKSRIDYSFLGAELCKHSLDNFLLLLEKVAAYVPDAWNLRRLETFLASLDPRPLIYFKAEEAENFDRWMLQWVRLEEEERAGQRGEP
jgi:hypothetical protein